MQIHTLDLHFQGKPNTIASYLIIGPDGPFLIETGPRSTLDSLLEELARFALSPEEIRYIFVTHIHLDHAGAAGWFAQQGSQIFVHPVGAPHLIDPAKLVSSAARIYGDQMDTLWGEVVPAPASMVTPISDGTEISVCGLSIKALDTPGHASHHHVYQLGDIAFTGDAAGIQIPGIYFVDLPAPPPEFNVEIWQATIDKMLQLPLSAIYPTHFGKIVNWRQQLTDLSKMLVSAPGLIQEWLEDGLEREEILERYLEHHRQRAQGAGMPQEIYDQYEAANPHYMSVDGIMRYWHKQQRKR